MPEQNAKLFVLHLVAHELCTTEATGLQND
jgi:hypothetical protein